MYVEFDFWKPCYDCTPRCNSCSNMYAWDKYGKPNVCYECKDFSNYTPDDSFCCSCGRPLTKIAFKKLQSHYKDVMLINL